MSSGDLGDCDYYGSDRPELLRFLVRHGRVGTRVLDVGCGTGAFGERLLDAGAKEVWGVERAEGPADVASTRLTRVVKGVFPTEAVLEGAPFDLVVFADSLEHMEDPWGALSFAKGMLVPNGQLLVSMPNVSHYSVVLGLLRGRFDYTAYGIVDRSHLRFFTALTISQAVTRAGYEVLAGESLIRPVRRRYLPLMLLSRHFAPHLVATHHVLLARPSS